MRPDPSQDPIVEDVRRSRAEVVRRSGGTLDALCDALEARQAAVPGGTVKQPPRKVEPAGPGGSATDAA